MTRHIVEAAGGVPPILWALRYKQRQRNCINSPASLVSAAIEQGGDAIGVISSRL